MNLCAKCHKNNATRQLWCLTCYSQPNTSTPEQAVPVKTDDGGRVKKLPTADEQAGGSFER